MFLGIFLSGQYRNVVIWADIIIGVTKKFLPNVSTKRLRDLEKNEKNPKAKTILLACIARK